MANSIFLYGTSGAKWGFLDWHRAGIDTLDAVERLQDVRGFGDILAVDPGNKTAELHRFPRFEGRVAVDPAGEPTEHDGRDALADARDREAHYSAP